MHVISGEAASGPTVTSAIVEGCNTALFRIRIQKIRQPPKLSNLFDSLPNPYTKNLCSFTFVLRRPPLLTYLQSSKATAAEKLE